MTALTCIDVWDAKTFDDELISILEAHAELVRGYMMTEHRIFLSYDLGRGSEKVMSRPHNPFSSVFLALKETLDDRLRSRIIRAWHYTRLTAQEIAAIRAEGIHLSTPTTLRSRLDLQVAAGMLSAATAETLYAASPFHSEQLKSRSGKFWMVSHPVAPDDGGVGRLMTYWGGEVAFLGMNDTTLLAPVARIGSPRILELAVPLSLTQHSYSAAGALLATFGRTLGCIPGKRGFDLYVTAPLPSDSVLQVHNEGSPTFNAMGTDYPNGYVDVDLTYWEELNQLPPKDI